ncbi:FtsW/RodA/SpoVE family cell cycle protein [Streptomyces sp. NPDC056244]|uniref:FtsW/RodA/SpoVE family cell cycle protein n=1 Tax=Streptomyces sp. NPDC056244 TaxID=3345762 RepID=UPI0035E1B713
MTATTADTPPPEPRLRKRRGVELSLLVCAVLISVFGYVSVGLGTYGAVPPGAAGYGAGLGMLALLAHIAVRLRAPYADPLLLPIAVLLNGLGLVLIYRLDLETPNAVAAPTQLVWSTFGVALFIAVVVFLRDHRALQRYAYLSVVTALVLLIVPIFYPAVNGAKIWIRIGGLSFQPGEFAKILLAVFFAAYLAANQNALTYTGRRFRKLHLPTGRVLGPVVAIWLLSVIVLVLERDLGTSLLFFGLFVILLYVATGRTGWIAVGLLLAAAGAFAAGSLEPHVHSRVQDWLHPFASIEAGRGPGQLAQSLFAFAAGGLSGTGLGRGESILIGFAAKSDFILATAGEELGLLGLAALFLLYGLLVARGYCAGLVLMDPFGRLLATGLASILALQVFVIAGGVMGLIPLTGMAMPFLAQGGSSVVTNWISVALLIRLSNSARSPRPEARTDERTDAASPAGPRSPAGPAGPASPVAPASPAEPDGPRSPTGRPDPGSLTDRSGPGSPTDRSGPGSPTGHSNPAGPTGSTGSTGHSSPAVLEDDR